MTIQLVEQVQTAITRPRLDVSRLIQTLEELLQYRCTPSGRTSANCAYVDSYFMEHSDWAELGLPDELHDLFGHMDALHDTCSAPAVAQNFESSPEQLLERLRRTRTELTD